MANGSKRWYRKGTYHSHGLSPSAYNTVQYNNRLCYVAGVTGFSYTVKYCMYIAIWIVYFSNIFWRGHLPFFCVLLKLLCITSLISQRLGGAECLPLHTSLRQADPVCCLCVQSYVSQADLICCLCIHPKADRASLLPLRACLRQADPVRCSAYMHKAGRSFCCFCMHA